MPSNYVLLEKITVGAAGASSVTFSSIPQTGYTDLVLKMSVRTNRASTDDLLNFNFNGVSTNQSSRWLQGNGSTASSGTYGSNLYLAWVDAASNTASTFGNAEMYITNYTSANFKSISTDGVLENNGTTAIAGLTAGLWSSTAAITSIAITSVFSANFVQGSTFYLYGVAKLGTTPAIAPKATGGDIIDTDGTYWYHTFRSSGTFTPTANLTADYLVVAGGGSGGTYAGGGGGAGGFRTSIGGSALSLTSGTGYTATIGAGGAASTGFGNNGSNSVFSTITSTGGGGGAGNTGGTVGGNGGSGGGGSGTGIVAAGGAGTAGQGNNGGSGGNGSGGGGGGGGAGAVGTNAVVGGGNGGAGGSGLSSSISGSSVTYAGGGGGAGTSGGGGAGGTGGGGTGNTYQGANSVAGTANTGGGGGGDWVGLTGAAGGSGIVIVRYAV